MTKDDPDGDGIASALDNCPTISNAGQFNEDTDKFGDACDPCPVDKNDVPVDPDGDGVSDSCDPHPNTAGDKIVVFEGFHAPLPATWTVIGNAIIANDEVALTVVAGNHSAVVPPGGPFANGTLSVSIIVDAQVGQFDSAATISMPYDPTDDQGVFCEMYAPMAQSSNGRYVSVWDSPAQMERGKNGFAWTTNTAYRLVQTRTGTNYVCNLIAGGQAHNANGSTQSSPSPQKAAFATYGANARAQWMMVVTSP
jgi:hypothetical protein